MKKITAEQSATCPDTTRAERAETGQDIPDSTLELIARLDPTFFPATSGARRALAQDRPVSLGRHKRNCSICAHPQRDAIEQYFLHWRSPEEIAEQFGLPDWSSVYRHVRAFGLFAERRRNVRFALENLIERVNEIQVVTPSGFVSAVRAFTCINEQGEWIEPVKRVVITHVSLAPSPQRAEERLPAIPHQAGEGASENSGNSLAQGAVDAKAGVDPAATTAAEAKASAEEAEALKVNLK